MRSVLAAAVVCIAVFGARATAIERTRLPVFELTSMSGQAVTSERLIRSGRWLVIYAQPDCAACDALLRLVVSADRAHVATRVAIVEYGATAETLRTIAARYPDLATSHWFADRAGASAASLQLTGTPAIFGMNGDMIEWSLAGVLSSPDVKAVVANWIEGS
jgi:hypothetical protein